MKELKSKGFTLLEIMLALAIASIFIAIIQAPVLSFHQMVLQQKQSPGIEGDLERFLMLLKTELLQSGYGFVSGGYTGEAVIIAENSITLKADYNLDGDTLDKSESITYRYDANIKELKRQSKNSAYQTFIEGVELVQFASANISQSTVGTSKTCVVVSIQATSESNTEQFTLCPYDL